MVCAIYSAFGFGFVGVEATASLDEDGDDVMEPSSAPSSSVTVHAPAQTPAGTGQVSKGQKKKMKRKKAMARKAAAANAGDDAQTVHDVANGSAGMDVDG